MKFRITAEEARKHLSERAEAYEARAESIKSDVIIRPNEAKVKLHLQRSAAEFRWAAAHLADGDHEITDDEIAAFEFIPPPDITIPKN